MKLYRFLGLLLVAGTLHAQVTFNRILNASHEPQNWLTYGGSYASQRYSLLDQINPDNVRNLRLDWVWHPQSLYKMELTPLVVDGVLYGVQGNEVVALDAATGRNFWTFTHNVPPESNAYVLVVKGLAMSGHTLFWATYDGHLIAIDARDGHAIWDHTLFDWRKAGLQLNLAPLVIKNMVILGTADNEDGKNCWIAAYDIKTGKELWRFWTAPNSPTDPGADTWANDSGEHGGDPVWVTGSYDPETNLTFWGTGDPNPGWNGNPRAGDNLYGDCVLALNADTGKLKWYYQFTPHDERDYDSVQVPVLADIEWRGQPRKVMLWANRNGMFYVLDRTTGQVLLGKPFVEQNWNLGLDAKGRPIPNPAEVPKPLGESIEMPGTQGGTNWYSPSFSPRTGLFYISTWANYNAHQFKVAQVAPWVDGQKYSGNTRQPAPAPGSPRQARLGMLPARYRTEAEGFGAVRAIDPQTGEKKWDFKMADYTESGVLSTASDLVFSGGRDGNLFALDARDGKSLWHVGLGGTVSGGPISYSVNGRQYIAAAAGGVLYVFSLIE
jgi:alcohol dehydrogenase (cytochrome c)